MAEIESLTPYLEPIRKSLVVRRAPKEAFEIFTARFGSWWPYKKFSLNQAATAGCSMELRAGGAIYETTGGGDRAVWGSVLVWEPPSRLVLAWHPGTDPQAPTEVELRFVPVAEGTRVELEHRHWTRLGARAEKARTSYENGWPHVFDECFREACS